MTLSLKIISRVADHRRYDVGVAETTIVGDDPLADGMRISVRMRRDFTITDAVRFLAAARHAYRELHPDADANEASTVVTWAADAVFTQACSATRSTTPSRAAYPTDSLWAAGVPRSPSMSRTHCRLGTTASVPATCSPSQQHLPTRTDRSLRSASGVGRRGRRQAERWSRTSGTSSRDEDGGVIFCRLTRL